MGAASRFHFTDLLNERKGFDFFRSEEFEVGRAITEVGHADFLGILVGDEGSELLGEGLTFGVLRVVFADDGFVGSEAVHVLRGAIDLDAPVTRYSKYSLPPEFGSVTLRDLLSHRSGLPIDFLNPWNPLAWHVALMSGLTGSHLYAAFDARTDFAEACWASRTRRFLATREPQYSNIGFALLVTAVEDATGRDVEEILREEVTRPMGLNDTAFVLNADQRTRLAQPSAGKLPWLVRRGRPVPAHELGPALRGMGGLYSSAADCTTFLSRCDVMKPGRLSGRQLPSGRWIDFRFGMIYGGETFFCRDRSTGGQLVILRNVTSWPAAEDFEIADRLFCSWRN